MAEHWKAIDRNIWVYKISTHFNSIKKHRTEKAFLERKWKNYKYISEKGIVTFK